mgnify:CR=1 FL=1
MTLHPAHRRGVLLLVAMAILALMSAITITFVLVTGIQMRAARSAALTDVEAQRPEDVLEEALDQVLVGTDNVTSVLRTASLLEDMYGRPPIKGRLEDLVSNSFGMELSSRFENFTPSDQPGAYDGRIITFIEGPAAGLSRRIIRTTPAQDDPPTANSVVQLYVVNFGGNEPDLGDRFIINDRPFDGTGYGLTSRSTLPASILGYKVNENPKATGDQRGWERALLPNHSLQAQKLADNEDYDDAADGDYLNAAVEFDPAGFGGADEDYDAADYQNLLLAANIWDTSPPGGGPPRFRVAIPSLHRPALINYWLLNRMVTDPILLGSAEAQRDLTRKILLRPNLYDHPGFSVANPAVPVRLWEASPPGTANFWFKDGPWDVDNDGNGEADSNWADIGLQVQTDSEGRRYKPLVAILCLDLDGRLNLNHHGAPMHLVRNNPNWPLVRFVGPFADQNSEALLPIGQGYGPADVMLNHVFRQAAYPTETDPFKPQELFWLLHGRYDTQVDPPILVAGRYGELYMHEQVLNTTNPRIPMPGRTTVWDSAGGDWGDPGFDDDLDGDNGNFTERGRHVPRFGTVPVGTLDDGPLTGWGDGTLQDDNFPPPPAQSAYGASLADLRGDVPVARSVDGTGNIQGHYGMSADMDGDGTPVVDLGGGGAIMISHGEGDDAVDDPYEFDTSGNRTRRMQAALNNNTVRAAADEPFTAADLETLMRIFDSDVGTLSDRLLQLAPETFLNGPQAQRNRNLVTYDSADIPVATRLAMGELQDDFGNEWLSRMAPGPLLDKLLELLVPAADDRADQQIVGLSPQLFDGLKLDINRLLGNGYDDDGDGVVDEPGEMPLSGGPQEELWSNVTGGPVRFDLDSDGHAPTPADAVKQGLLARHHLARHLYVLAVLLRNSEVAASEIDERDLAQWAINAVDFYDRDSVMTPFEYDTNILNGWDVDGDYTTVDTSPDRELIWGCERPELLITETVAGHDMATDDLQTPDGRTTDAPPNNDEDFDQVDQPMGWAMIEIFNPNSGMSQYPREFYEQPTPADRPELQLDKTVPGTTDQPIWRLAIGTPNTGAHPTLQNHPTPHDPERLDPVLLATSIERTVYFTQQAPNATITGGQVKYHRSAGGQIHVAPGGYVVVGSPGVAPGSPPSPVQTTSDLELGPSGTPPRIEMDNQGTRNLLVENDGMSNPYPRYQGDGQGAVQPSDDEVRPPLAITINSPHRFNISQPLDNYAGQRGGSTLPGAPEDQPWDAAANEEWYGVVGTTAESSPQNIGAYTRVYLQRLANPMEPWHDTNNPYLTVDSMPLDLWVYNTESTMPPAPQPEIRTRERLGDAPNPGATDPNSNLWRQWAGSEMAGQGNAPTANDGNFQHTLGYLNTPWQEQPAMAGDPRWWRRQELAGTLGVGTPLQSSGFDEDYFVGYPRRPIPWLPWNNRPYMSAYELMLVPKSSPSMLLAEYSLRDTGAVDMYDTEEKGEFRGDYDTQQVTHLLNFFQSSDGTERNDLYRIFDFIHVPSRFSGTTQMLDPKLFEASDQAAQPWSTTFAPNLTRFGWQSSFAGGRRVYTPPFNYLSAFREPGKVNINTIYHQDVLRGLLGGHWDPMLWDQFVDSRRGDGQTGNNMLGQPNPPSPTSLLPSHFARPFRGSGGGDYVPIADLEHPGVESTLMRPDPTNPNEPLLGFTSASPNTDSNRHSAFRYQLLNRLSNLVTTRSNVYAVWITVGFFEVEEAQYSPYYEELNYSQEEFKRALPDGFTLLGELGADTGETRRHRMFAIIDRTVPVAFERGKTHNTRKCVVLQSIIE